jgi:hypothetical protein
LVSADTLLLARLAEFDIKVDSTTWCDPWGAGFRPDLITSGSSVQSRQLSGLASAEAHAARIRYLLSSASELERPIEVDCRCSHHYILALPVIVDGWHRLHAHWHLGRPTIQAHFSGRLDLLEYLVGRTDVFPVG